MPEVGLSDAGLHATAEELCTLIDCNTNFIVGANPCQRLCKTTASRFGFPADDKARLELIRRFDIDIPPSSASLPRLPVPHVHHRRAPRSVSGLEFEGLRIALDEVAQFLVAVGTGIELRSQLGDVRP